MDWEESSIGRVEGEVNDGVLIGLLGAEGGLVVFCVITKGHRLVVWPSLPHLVHSKLKPSYNIC